MPRGEGIGRWLSHRPSLTRLPSLAAQDVIGVQRGVDADEGDRPRVAVRGRRNSGEGWDCTCDGATLVGARVGSLGRDGANVM